MAAEKRTKREEKAKVNALIDMEQGKDVNIDDLDKKEQEKKMKEVEDNEAERRDWERVDERV